MTLKEFYKKYDKEINKSITDALLEDNVRNDVTTNLLLKGTAGSEKLNAELLCKENCVLAGLDIFKKVYKRIDRSAVIKSYYKEGALLKKGAKVLEIKTSRRNLLIGERTALNFIQRMSGVASLTNMFVRQLKYKGAKVLHTRKTTPNFRWFEIAAVKTGGGDFHRFSLASSVLIKDNHIIARGGTQKVFDYLSAERLPAKLKHKFEIEVKTFKEIDIVVKRGIGLIKVVMLDNFIPVEMDKAVKILKKHKFKIEVSGGLNLQNFDKYQRSGIDYYSIGMLTHSYKSADFSLEF